MKIKNYVISAIIADIVAVTLLLILGVAANNWVIWTILALLLVIFAFDIRAAVKYYKKIR